MNDPFTLFYIFSAIAICISAFIIYRKHKRVMYLLEGWAQENGCKIISKKEALFFRGPFQWFGSRRTVYRIVVEDEAGLKKGWVGCDYLTWFNGAMPVEVVWDKAKPQSHQFPQSQ